MSSLYLNGKIIKDEKACLSVDNRSFRYGDGFFETIKFVKGKIPLWDYHAKRIFHTLPILRFECPAHLTADSLHENIMELVSKNQHQRLGRVRLTFFRNDGGLFDDISHLPNIMIQSWELNPHYNFINENGLVTGLYREGVKALDSFSNLKTNNYLLYVMAALEAKSRQWNDAFVLNQRGSICDASIANIWVVRDGVVMTPRLTDGPVAGVMRQYLLTNLARAGWKTMEATLTQHDLEKADEIFLTNAMYGLRWVKEYEGRNYSSFQAARINANLIAPLWATTK